MRLPCHARCVFAAAFCAALALSARAEDASAAAGEAGSAEPVRIAVMYFTRPADNVVITRAVKKALTPLLAPRPLELKFVSVEDFDREALAAHTNLILAPAGHARRLAHRGIEPIATIVSRPNEDPNYAEGATVIVRADRHDLQTLGDLRDRTIAANNPLGFTGWQIVLGEVVKFGVADPQKFFGQVIFMGDPRAIDHIGGLVLDGTADAGFLRLCAYETFLSRHPEAKGLLRVIDRRESKSACALSTDLYPGFMLAATPNLDPDLMRRIALALYSMKPDEGEPRWAMPANLLAIDRLLQNLEAGPWENLWVWSAERFMERHFPWILLSALLILGLMLHSWRVELASRRRGEQVRALMKKEMEQAEVISAMHHSATMVQLANLFAHELRQPLACASLYAEGLARQFRRGKFDPEKLAQACDKVADETQRASEIVERVRAYARGQGSDRRLLSAAILMKESVRIWQTHSALDIPLELITPPRDVFVEGSPFELETAFINLLKNAREAVQTLPSRAIAFTGAAEGESVIFKVLDSGPPPSDETLARLGKPASSEKAHGLGLGLSITSSLIEDHGGSIAFSRGPGDRFTGLAVTVTLPRTRAESLPDLRLPKQKTETPQ